jgi:hypothetical protein
MPPSLADMVPGADRDGKEKMNIFEYLAFRS